ncbi:TetR/AcrR family transcriptional regulator [Humibacter ginsenosidimutans]|uniref:TetR/AcrR family transcriptional regulator n=1 Tax=Humibacter ginsenosidimutans TaxID=2599293 RepID=A0A5B8M7W2_9MICO|nr:TetR/AcrR family transcriptional regulator [Humibacter ginsenosidimutans]
MEPGEPGRPLSKAERTRTRIRDTAVRSFRENGFDATTMRRVADEAGVSLGNAYYYFPTKNHLVQELYVEVQEAHRSAVEPRLRASTDLVERLGIVYREGLAQLAPFHEFAPGFLNAMISPTSPLNPLSPESGPAREITVGLFREAVTGARNRLPAEFEARMPDVLWLGHLQLSLYWSYDQSEGQQRTQRLLDQGLRLLKVALPAIRMPFLRAPVRSVLDLVAEVGL